MKERTATRAGANTARVVIRLLTAFVVNGFSASSCSKRKIDQAVPVCRLDGDHPEAGFPGRHIVSIS